MRSLFWLLAIAAIVIAITQINAVLGTNETVVVSSIGELFWLWRGFGAFVVLLGLLAVSLTGLHRSVVRVR